jgi:hypothetical protein
VNSTNDDPYAEYEGVLTPHERANLEGAALIPLGTPGELEKAAERRRLRLAVAAEQKARYERLQAEFKEGQDASRDEANRARALRAATLAAQLTVDKARQNRLAALSARPMATIAPVAAAPPTVFDLMKDMEAEPILTGKEMREADMALTAAEKRAKNLARLRDRWTTSPAPEPPATPAITAPAEPEAEETAETLAAEVPMGELNPAIETVEELVEEPKPARPAAEPVKATRATRPPAPWQAALASEAKIICKLCGKEVPRELVRTRRMVIHDFC